MIGEIKDGFKFTSIVYPFNKYDAIEITEDRDIRDYINYINKNQIEQAYIVMPNIDFIRECPSLKYLRIDPYFDAPDFDYSPLYEMPKILFLSCRTQYGLTKTHSTMIDYANIQGIQDICVNAHKREKNYNNIRTLKSLNIGSFKGSNGDLTDMFCSKQLDTLSLLQCGVTSLNGIETSEKMQCVYLDYNRSLKDISALSKVKKTLKALRIDKCPQIEDFSALEELENIEHLWLTGSNKLPSLSFIKKTKKLKTLILEMDVLDGDLTPCLDLSYVYSRVNRKHYNLKDKDLPKGTYVRGNEDIEVWRRLQ